MDVAAREAMIVGKLRAGALPRPPCSRLWAGFGGGQPCAACEEAINAPAIEYECAGDGPAGTVRMCRPCFAIWEALTKQ